MTVRSSRRARTSVLGAVLAAPLAVATLAGPPASAATPAAAAQDPAALAATLAARFAAASPGVYTDGRTVVVTTTDAATAASARAAGARVRTVARSAKVLAAARAALEKGARVPGTAWAVDPVANQVVVTVGPGVTSAGYARLTRVTTALGSAVSVRRSSATYHPLVSGGSAIYTGQYRCSLGFNVRSGSPGAYTYSFLTAGHCTNLGTTWYGNSSKTTVLGTRSGTSFPGNDYGIVRYTNASVSHPGNVTLSNGSTQDITRAGTAVVGETVTRSGSTTGVHTGKVTAVNATVNYAEGSVSGLIRTTVCAEGGDSGGPLFDGTTALGLTSGGSGNCSSGGTTFFQPVTEVLAAYGVSVY